LIVLDASALIDLLLRGEGVEGIEDLVFAPGESLTAPHLIDLEVAQVLRRYRRAGELSDSRAEVAFDDLAALSLQRYPHDILLPRIWELRHNATAYDAAYLALAEALDATLLTRDRGLAASRGHRARIALV
jgi:predicted nucleic acid-binding protein